MKSIKNIKPVDWLVIVVWIIFSVLAFNWHKNTIADYEQKLEQYRLLTQNAKTAIPKLDDSLVSISIANAEAGRIMKYEFGVQGQQYEGTFTQKSDSFSDSIDFTKVYYLPTNPAVNAINPIKSLANITRNQPTNFRQHLFYVIVAFTFLTICGTFLEEKKADTD